MRSYIPKKRILTTNEEIEEHYKNEQEDTIDQVRLAGWDLRRAICRAQISTQMYNTPVEYLDILNDIINIPGVGCKIILNDNPPPRKEEPLRAVKNVREIGERIKNHEEYICPFCKRCICKFYKDHGGDIFSCTPNSSDIIHNVFWNYDQRKWIWICDDCKSNITIRETST